MKFSEGPQFATKFQKLKSTSLAKRTPSEFNRKLLHRSNLGHFRLIKFFITAYRKQLSQSLQLPLIMHRVQKHIPSGPQPLNALPRNK